MPREPPSTGYRSRLRARARRSAFAQPSYEINVSGDPAVKDGEPSLAVNPSNPQNLIIGHMKEIGRDFGEAGRCAVAASFDQGLTWQRRLLPLTDAFYSVCARSGGCG